MANARISMHNSLHIRELLRRTNSDPLRIDRRDPHRLISVDPSAAPTSDDIRLDGEWDVVSCSGSVLEPAVRDVSEFLGLMGISVVAGGDNAVELRIAPDLSPRAFRIVVSPSRVVINGGDIAGAWAGIAWMERMMRVRRGPFLPTGIHERTARWRTQITQGPWGGNYSVPDFSPEYLSDDAFRLYAHYGVNSMMIYGDLLCYANSSILPELNHPDYDHHIEMLRDASRRAAQYGVQFTYVVVGAKLRADHPVFVNHPSTLGAGKTPGGESRAIHCLCSSDEKVLAFYRETFRNILRAAPELAGFICIIGGESFYHCRMWPHSDHLCEKCFLHRTEDVVSSLLGNITDAVQTEKPGAFVAAWPYNTDSWDNPDALELLRTLPKNVSYLDQFDRKQLYDKGSYRKLVWDYSVDYIGPADQHVARARIARERGLGHYVRTETGIGLEVFQFPYVPSMFRLADKWEVVRDLAPDGVHQAWLFFGMFGSRAEELGLRATYGDYTPNEFIREMAVRDFGPDTVEHVLTAWRTMSEAVGHIPSVTLHYYYVGPSFLGPCHPLIPEKDSDIPDVFDAVLFYLQEGEETFSRKRTEVRTSLVMADLPETAASINIEWDSDSDGWDIVLTEYREAARLAEASWQSLLDAAKHTRISYDAQRLEEETLLTELVYRTFETCANTVEFLHLRDRNGNADRMREIARQELENAERSRPIYEKCPWLDIAERTDGVYSKCTGMIDAKAAMLRQYLAE